MSTDTSATSPGINPWIIAISVMLATFMEVLDTTVVNVSLPHIAGNMSASVSESTWTLTSYLVANAIILPLTGWLARHFGRKRLLMMAVVGFTAASFMCGLAWNLMSLIVFRVIQGLSGGALQPLSQAVLLETFPPRERGKDVLLSDRLEHGFVDLAVPCRDRLRESDVPAEASLHLFSMADDM